MNEENLSKVMALLGSEKIRRPGRSGNMSCSCPLARWSHGKGEDKLPSFSVKPVDGGPSPFRCFACGIAGPSVLWVVQDVNRRIGGDKLKELEAKVAEMEKTDPLAESRAAARSVGREIGGVGLSDDDVWEDKEIEQWVGQVPRYALERGLTIETCKAWGLGYDKHGARLVFPVRRTDGKLVGVTGRGINSTVTPRYKDYWGFRKGSYLYGEWMYREEHGKLFVVEGLFDTLLAWQRGVRNVVATMGASATKEQVRKVRDYGVPVYLMQDNDAAGAAARERMCESLKGRVPVWKVPLPPDGDPDEMSEEEMKGAVNAAEFVG